MPLSKEQKLRLKKLVHHLKPVVLLGQHGLTDAVLNEIDIALGAHELIKVRLGGEDKEERKAMQEAICQRTGAEFIHAIGHVAAFFRRNPDNPKIDLH
jgi:RNA-binding protein